MFVGTKVRRKGGSRLKKAMWGESMETRRLTGGRPGVSTAEVEKQSPVPGRRGRVPDLANENTGHELNLNIR